MIFEFKKFPVVLSQDLVWGDMDAFQHLNNTVYFRYFEDVRMAYFNQIGIMDFMRDNNKGPIVASTSCNFKAPLQYPDQLSIAARVTDIEAKKFCMKYLVFSHKLNKIAADGEALIVYFDYTERNSCKIPDKIIQQIHKQENLE